MGKHQTNSSLNYLNPIFKVSTVLLIHPKYNTFKYEICDSRQRRFISVLFCIVYLLIFSCSMYIRVSFLYKKFENVETFIDFVYTITIFLTNVTITVSMGVLNLRHFNEALKKLIEVDVILCKYSKPKKISGWFYTNLLLVIILAIASILIALILHLYKNESVWERVCFAIDYIGKARSIYAIFLIVVLVNDVKHKLEKLNDILNTTFDFISADPNGIDDFKTIKVRNKGIGEDVQNMVKIFSSICDIIHNFNRVFGWTILYYTLCTISGLLIGVNYSLDLQNRQKITERFLLIGFSIAGVTTFYQYKLVHHCDNLAKAAENVAATALKVSETLDNIKFPFYDRPKEDLILLAEQATSHIPKITAAGFFNVQFRIIFVLMEIVTTNILMLMQFKL